MLAKTGEEQLVPKISLSPPFMMTAKFLPCAETSGKPLPLVLNKPAFVVPNRSRYALTASAITTEVVWSRAEGIVSSLNRVDHGGREAGFEARAAVDRKGEDDDDRRGVASREGVYVPRATR